MKSTIAFTYEMDNMKLVAEQLAHQIKSELTLQTKSFGIIFADSELDHQALLRVLNKELPIPIIGCTTTAIIEGKEGFHEMCTSLMVVTGEDYCFSIARSEILTNQNVYDEIEQTYQKGKEALNGEDAKLVFALPPYNLDIMLDEFPERLSKIAGDLPVFGGLASFHDAGDTIANLDGQEVYDDRMVLLLLGGDIKPIFSTGSVIGNPTQKKAVVTKAEGNVVYTVEDKPFIDYCNSIGLSMLKLPQGDSLPFVTTPMVIEPASDEESDGVPIIRAIHEINEADGSCTAICKVPQNSILSIASLNGKDIEASTQEAIDALLKQMEENTADGYEYSTILCISCIGRFLIMAPYNEMEGKIIAQSVPEHIQVMGCYGYGEIGPTSVRNGKSTNRAHNHSIVMLAI